MVSLSTSTGLRWKVVRDISLQKESLRMSRSSLLPKRLVCIWLLVLDRTVSINL